MNYEEQCSISAERQGITAICKALANAGITSTIEQTGGFYMVAYVKGTNGLRLGVTSESLVLIEDDEEETELVNYETSGDGEISTKQLSYIVGTVKETMYLLTNPYFSCDTYWVDDMNIACEQCYKDKCQEYELFELVGTAGEEYEPETLGGGLICGFCRTLCTEETEEPGYSESWTIN